MGHIRFLKNVRLILTKDNIDKEQHFPAGRFLQVDNIVNLDAQYADITTHDGWIIDGLDKSCFSVQGDVVITDFIHQLDEEKVSSLLDEELDPSPVPPSIYKKFVNFPVEVTEDITIMPPTNEIVVYGDKNDKKEESTEG